MLRRRTGQPDERGATLVEFAFVLPVFILFLFAIIDFGWLFAQFLDVKQGAREGARLAIVNDCPGINDRDRCRDEIVEKICARTSDLDDNFTTVRLGEPALEAYTAEVEVTYPAKSLTGLMAVFINDRTLTATVRMRREKPRAWNTGPAQACP